MRQFMWSNNFLCVLFSRRIEKCNIGFFSFMATAEMNKSTSMLCHQKSNKTKVYRNFVLSCLSKITIKEYLVTCNAQGVLTYIH